MTPGRLIVFAAGLALILGAAGARAASICLPPSPLPTAPGAGAQSVSFSGAITSTASYAALFWREPCVSNTAISVLYLRVTPPPGDSVVLRALSVVQGATQSNAY